MVGRPGKTSAHHGYEKFGGLPEDQNGCSDPNILVDRKTGEIFVSAVWTHGKPGTHQWRGKGSEPGHSINKSSQFMIVRSKDDGLTWSEPENWTKRLKDPKWCLFAPAAREWDQFDGWYTGDAYAGKGCNRTPIFQFYVE